MDRLSFFKNIARGSILTGLGIITVSLFNNKNETNICHSHFMCSKCNSLSNCKLPEADRFKEVNKINNEK